MCVIPVCGHLFLELEHIIQCQFLPTVFGVEISAVECDLFALPLRFGGLGVGNPLSMAAILFDTSVRGTAPLV